METGNEEQAVNSAYERAPDKRPLTRLQAWRLAQLTGVDIKELRGRPIVELRDRLRWQIDPELFLFRRFCGRVVKHDPVTGVDHPVPFATVYVEDTDCNFLGLFPVESPWAWLFPVFCRREVIATVHTDACGHFCVWIPQFDIDWILRWRRERRCYWDLFVKPNIRELLEAQVIPHVHEEQPFRPPRPGDPDPPPFTFTDLGMGLQRLEAVLGPQAAIRLLATRSLISTVGLGEQLTESQEFLSRPAFIDPAPPPIPSKLLTAYARRGEQARDLGEEEASDEETILGMVEAAGLASDTDGDEERAAERGNLANARVDLSRFIGPLWRCRDVFVPVLAPILDVPDITFRVTQDVNNDGTEETIYTEGFFDVRWNAAPIPNVTLYASSIAFAVPSCESPYVPCEEPGLFLVEKMPLLNPEAPAPGDPPTYPYVNTGSGYAVRPNRPHSTGRVDQIPTATTYATASLTSRVTGFLDFFGCTHRTREGVEAQFYRVLSRTSTNNGTTWSLPTPVLQSWYLYRLVGSPPHLEFLPITFANTDGWYPVVDPIELWAPGLLALRWTTPPDGFYELVVELGDAGQAIIDTSAPVRIRIDNTRPHAAFTKLEWRALPFGSWNEIPLSCPVIHRGGANIQVRLTLEAWATHLRSVELSANGCGGGVPTLSTGFEALQSGALGATAAYWHKNANDNILTPGHMVIYNLSPGMHPAGAYRFDLWAYSRAFHPATHEFAPTSPDVGFNPAPVFFYDNLPIAIVD